MDKSQRHILVTDDEEHISELVKYNLEKAGFMVSVCHNGLTALQKIEDEKIDLLVLDLMLPDIDGIEVCKRVRKTEKNSELPIIMLTAKSEEIDRILGLELGADDYMTKPFSVKELVARVKTVLRRADHHVEEPSAIIEWDKMIMDLERHEVTIDGQSIDLTLKEYELLKYLMKNRGRVMSRNLLLDEIWGYDYFGETRTVDVHIRNIRKKIGEHSEEDYIETVRGVGYKIKQEK